MVTINWTHCTLIVPAALAPTCRALAAALAPSGAGMWTTPLSPTGAEPATHYISTGSIDAHFASLLDSPELLAAATGVPLAQAQNILSACDISDGPARDAMQRLGLWPVVVHDGEGGAS